MFYGRCGGHGGRVLEEWHGTFEAEVKALVGDGLVREFGGDFDGSFALWLEGVREV